LHDILAASRSISEKEQVFHALSRSPAQSPLPPTPASAAGMARSH